MPDAQLPILAVLIDADNTPSRHARAILDEIAKLGVAALRRVYGDMASPHLRGWNDLVPGLGLHPIHAPANTTGKNASDIGLVIDAMDQLHSGRYGAFVLVSSDSDFTRLASRIREDGVPVYGVGQKKTPESFQKACNRFIFLENLGESVDETRDRPPAGPATVSPALPTPAASPATTGKTEALTEARVLLTRAFDALASDADWLRLSELGQYLVNADPGFDPRSYGQKKLSDLVKAVKLFEVRPGEHNQILLRRKD